MKRQRETSHWTRRFTFSRPSKRRGAVAALMTVMMPMLLVLSAYAINTANLELYQTEMYCAADAAARATGREFSVTRDKNAANATGKVIAALNTVAGKPLILSDSDIEYGSSHRQSVGQRYDFIAGADRPNSVRITANRTAGSPSGALPLVLPQFVGMKSADHKQTAVSTQVEVDISLVIDRSGSMAFATNEIAGPGIPPSAPPGWTYGMPAPPASRWRNLVSSVGYFLNELNVSTLDARVSLASYSNSAVVDKLLTDDYTQTFNAMQPYTNAYQQGATNIGGGIQQGQYTLFYSPMARSGVSKVMVVLTDGMHNTGLDPYTAARAAAAQGVQIFTITFSQEADQGAMQLVASEGKGMHFHANNVTDLKEAFRQIALRLPTLLTR